MRVTMLLADFAQVSDGKLTIVGGGWSLTGPEAVPFGIAILIRVPWDQANQRHVMRLELLDADGQPVEMETDEGEQQVVFFDDVHLLANMLTGRCGFYPRPMFVFLPLVALLPTPRAQSSARLLASRRSADKAIHRDPGGPHESVAAGPRAASHGAVLRVSH